MYFLIKETETEAAKQVGEPFATLEGARKVLGEEVCFNPDNAWWWIEDDKGNTGDH